MDPTHAISTVIIIHKPNENDGEVGDRFCVPSFSNPHSNDDDDNDDDDDDGTILVLKMMMMTMMMQNSSDEKIRASPVKKPNLGGRILFP